MMTPADKTIAAEDTGSPTEFTSRRQAAQTVMAVGTTVAAGMAVATMPALLRPRRRRRLRRFTCQLRRPSRCRVATW